MHIFSLADALDAAKPAPYLSLSAHTLGVTGFATRIAGMTGRVVTCARDRTVKVRCVGRGDIDAPDGKNLLKVYRFIF